MTTTRMIFPIGLVAAGLLFALVFAASAQHLERSGDGSIFQTAGLESREKTGDGLWVLSTGHSCVAPAIRPFTQIARAAGRENHTQIMQFGGGESGAARRQWERTGEKQAAKPALESGRFDIMTFGHFLKGAEVDDYERWIDLALKHNPEMQFYIQDLWPWTRDLFDKESGAVTLETYDKAMADFSADLDGKVKALNEKYNGRVRVIPAGPGMVELVKRFEAGKLSGVDALVVGPKEKGVGLYRDQIHPTGVVSALEGYIYYASLYGENPLKLKGFALYRQNDELDQILREVAWKVVAEHLPSGRNDHSP